MSVDIRYLSIKTQHNIDIRKVDKVKDGGGRREEGEAVALLVLMMLSIKVLVSTM